MRCLTIYPGKFNMGKNKYKKRVEELLEKSPVVSYESIRRIVTHKDKNNSYTKRMVDYLVKKQSLKRLTKGYYTAKNNNSLVVFCLQPAYFGLQDALSFYDLWEQETIPVIITSRNVRGGMRKILGGNVFIRKMEKKYFFGIKYHLQENIAFPYSDIEKTLIDMIYFKEKIDGKTLRAIKNKINRKKLDTYLKKYSKRIVNELNDLLGS